MSRIPEGQSPWYGISRVLPDGSVVTPQNPGIIARMSPPAEILQAVESPCKPVVVEGKKPMTPEEIHKRALVEEGESMRAVAERLLTEGSSEVVFKPGK